MALLWDICNSSWCYSESIFEKCCFYWNNIDSFFFLMIYLIYECQIILDVMMWSATLTQVITYCRQCGKSPGHLKSWFENFAMCGAQDSVHIASNVVCYYFKIRPAVTLIFSLNVSIFHSGWCEEVGVDS